MKLKNELKKEYRKKREKDIPQKKKTVFLNNHKELFHFERKNERKKKETKEKHETLFLNEKEKVCLW